MKRGSLRAIAWVALAASIAAEPLSAQRLQEGAVTKHFDGHTHRLAKLQDVNLAGRCIAVPDVFSGRPNPRLVLSPAAARHIWKRIRHAALIGPTAAVRVGDGGLGYRGIQLRCDTRPYVGDLLLLCDKIIISADAESVGEAPELERGVLSSSMRSARVSLQKARDRACGTKATRE